MTPSTVNLTIVKGDDFSQQFQLLECSTLTPSQLPTGILTTSPTVLGNATYTTKDLTGCTVASQIRKMVNKSETLLATFTVAVDNVTHGVFTLTLPNATTTTFILTEGATYAYDVQVTDTNGKITTYIAGEIELLNHQTR